MAVEGEPAVEPTAIDWRTSYRALSLGIAFLKPAILIEESPGGNAADAGRCMDGVEKRARRVSYADIAKGKRRPTMLLEHVEFRNRDLDAHPLKFREEAPERCCREPALREFEVRLHADPVERNPRSAQTLYQPQKRVTARLVDRIVVFERIVVDKQQRRRRQLTCGLKRAFDIIIPESALERGPSHVAGTTLGIDALVDHNPFGRDIVISRQHRREVVMYDRPVALLEHRLARPVGGHLFPD